MCIEKQSYFCFFSFQIATRGSILYFSLLSLKGLDSVYQYSLNWFLKIFCHCIQDVSTLGSSLGGMAKGALLEACEVLTFTVFKAVAVGLSSEHFIPFVFKLCCSIKLRGDSLLGLQPTIAMPEWTAFLQDTKGLSVEAVNVHTHSSAVHVGTGGQQLFSGADASNSSDFIKPNIFSEEKWDAALWLEYHLDCFANLRKELSDNATSCSSLDCHNFWEILLKKPYFMQLSKFQQLILLQHLAPECLVTFVKHFISSELGKEYNSKPLINLKEIFESSDKTSPVMFILTPGTFCVCPSLPLQHSLCRCRPQHSSV